MCEGTGSIIKERSVEGRCRKVDRKADRQTVRQADVNEETHECKEECARFILTARKDVKK